MKNGNEERRLECLARHLATRGRDVQEAFYKKNPGMKKDLVNRIRGQLAAKLAAMPERERNARMQRYANHWDLHADLTRRVQQLLKEA